MVKILNGLAYLSVALGTCSFASSHSWIDARANLKVEYRIESKAENGRSIYLTVTASDLNGKKWELRDFIKSCSEDPVLEVIDKSVTHYTEPITLNTVYLFAYRLGCVGGIDPLDIKYFAFIDAQKYAMRGEETIICDGAKFGGELGPKADSALKNKPQLYDFMLKKWNTFSIKKCGK